MPKVSILTPVYNGARYFGETLDSVRNQNFTDWEHIIVDDCSNDGTFNLFNDSTLKARWFINSENLGEAKSVNRAYSEASGDYILILNSDDLVNANLLSKAVRILDANPSIDVVYPDWHMIDEHGDLIQEVETSNYSRRELFESFVCIPGPGAVFRNHGLPQLRDPSYRWAGDYDQWLKMAKEDNFERIPEPLASWRKHTGAQTHQRGLEMANERIRLIRNAFMRSNSSGLSRRNALSAAYYFAARLRFFDKKVPSFPWVLKSYFLRLRSPKGGTFRRPIPITLLLIFPWVLEASLLVLNGVPSLRNLLEKASSPTFVRRLNDALSNIE